MEKLMRTLKKAGLITFIVLSLSCSRERNGIIKKKNCWTDDRDNKVQYVYCDLNNDGWLDGRLEYKRDKNFKIRKKEHYPNLITRIGNWSEEYCYNQNSYIGGYNFLGQFVENNEEYVPRQSYYGYKLQIEFEKVKEIYNEKKQR